MSSQAVSSASILCLCVSLLICVGLPVALMIWGKVKYRKAFSFLPLLGGFLGFFISQILFRIPMMEYVLPLMGWYKALMKTPWPYAIFLALTAGLVEEPARFIVFSIMKKKHKYPDGLSYGIGHGGTESILLSGLSIAVCIFYAFKINAGTWNVYVASKSAFLQSQYILTGNSLIAAQPASFLIGGAERIFAIAIQIGLSLVVLKGFMTGKKWRYLLLAIGLHALVDFPAALVDLGVWKVNMLVLEGIVLVEAALALLYIIKQAGDWRRSLPAAGAVPQDELRTEEAPE